MGRHNTLPFSLIRSTVTASVRRPRPPLKSATGRTVRNRPVLGSLGGQRTQRIALRCEGCSQKGIRGAMSPNRRLSQFFTEKLALLGRRACYIQYSKVLQTTAKKVVNFFATNALALSFCRNQCKILATPLCITGRRRANAIVPIDNNGK